MFIKKKRRRKKPRYNFVRGLVNYDNDDDDNDDDDDDHDYYDDKDGDDENDVFFCIHRILIIEAPIYW